MGIRSRWNVDKPVAVGVLELLPGRERNRIYLARGILAVIEQENAPDASASGAPAPA